MKDWSITPDKKPEWPLGGDGEKIAPAFLERKCGSRFDLDMEIGLLAAYGIPVVCSYPNGGEFSELILGYPVSGADLYVPETLLEDARNILSCDLAEEEPEAVRPPDEPEKEDGDV